LLVWIGRRRGHLCPPCRCSTTVQRGRLRNEVSGRSAVVKLMGTGRRETRASAVPSSSQHQWLGLLLTHHYCLFSKLIERKQTA